MLKSEIENEICSRKFELLDCTISHEYRKWLKKRTKELLLKLEKIKQSEEMDNI